jgi:hypothetical protein
MNELDEEARQSLYICNIITITLLQFVFGCVEALYLKEYDNYKDECENVWYFILIVSVLQIFYGIISGCGIFKIQYKKTDFMWKFLLFLELVFFSANIWGLIIYNNLKECNNFWKDNAYPIYHLLTIHYIYTWCCFVIIMIYILRDLLICFARMCMYYCKSEPQEITNYSSSKNYDIIEDNRIYLEDDINEVPHNATHNVPHNGDI